MGMGGRTRPRVRHRTMGAVAILGTVLLAASIAAPALALRILADRHWLSDLVIGAVIGSASAGSCRSCTTTSFRTSRATGPFPPWPCSRPLPAPSTATPSRARSDHDVGARDDPGPCDGGTGTGLHTSCTRLHTRLLFLRRRGRHAECSRARTPTSGASTCHESFSRSLCSSASAVSRLRDARALRLRPMWARPTQAVRCSPG